MFSRSLDTKRQFSPQKRTCSGGRSRCQSSVKPCCHFNMSCMGGHPEILLASKWDQEEGKCLLSLIASSLFISGAVFTLLWVINCTVLCAQQKLVTCSMENFETKLKLLNKKTSLTFLHHFVENADFPLPGTIHFLYENK